MNQRIDILKKISTIVSEVLDEDISQLTEQSVASDFEYWDSINHLNIILEIEKEFGIKFSVSEFSHMKNVGDLMNMICDKVKI